MPALVEIGEVAAETALTFMPWLVDVPVLGRILIALSPGGGAEFKAMEQLQKQADAKKTDRATRIKRNGRYVLKASDAMQCVETHLMNGGVLLAFGKALVDMVFRGSYSSAPDLMCDRIFTCIEQHVLKQTSPRIKNPKTINYPRPARGHGKGRSF